MSVNVLHPSYIHNFLFLFYCCKHLHAKQPYKHIAPAYCSVNVAGKPNSPTAYSRYVSHVQRSINESLQLLDMFCSSLPVSVEVHCHRLTCEFSTKNLIKMDIGF